MRKIFVSSTFADFNEERDWLRNQIQPLLNKEATKYGEYVQFCDLRWGIDTATMEDEVADRKVLQVCMDEIDNAEPYTLILLGERYGSILPKTVMEKTLTEKSIDFSEQLNSLEISVTQLEIEYALFRNKDNLKRTFVYIREIRNDSLPENFIEANPEKKEKLEALKKRLYQLPDVCVKTYEARLTENGLDCGDGFIELVYRDLSEKLEQEWKEYDALLPFEKENLFHWNYIKRKLIGRGKFTSYQYFEEDKKGIVKLEKQLSNREIDFARVCLAHQKEDWKVIPMYGGKTESTQTAEGMLQHIISMLKKDLGIGQEQQMTLEELFETYEQTGQNLLVAICGIEAVADIERKIQLLLPERTYIHVKYYIMGYFGNCPALLQHLRANDFSTLMSMVPKVPDIIQKYFDDYGKEIEESTMQRLVEKLSKWSFSFAEIALQMLLSLDRDDFDKMYRLDRKQKTYLLYVIEEIIPDREEKILPLFISVIAKRLNELWLEDAVKFLALAEYGLRQTDMEQLMRSMNKPFAYVSFLQMMNYTEGIFEEQENGCYAFADYKMKESFLMGMSAQEKLIYAQKLADYLETLPKEDKISQAELLHAKSVVKQITFCQKIISVTTFPAFSEEAQNYADWLLCGGLERAEWFEQAVWYYKGFREDERCVVLLGDFLYYYVVTPKKENAENAAAYEYIIRKGFGFLNHVQEIHKTEMLHFLTLNFGAFAGEYYESKETAGAYQQASFTYYLAYIQIEKCKEMLMKKPGRLEKYEAFFDSAFKRVNAKASGTPFDITNLYMV